MKSILLTSVQIHKFKLYNTTQRFDVDSQVTVLVGKNESGKSAALEAVAKTNYFDQADEGFKYGVSDDYPRAEKKEYDKRYKQNSQPDVVVTSQFTITPPLLEEIENEFGKGVLKSNQFLVVNDYNNRHIVSDLEVDIAVLVGWQTRNLQLPAADAERLAAIQTREDFEKLGEELTSEHEQLTTDAAEVAAKSGEPAVEVAKGVIHEAFEILKPLFDEGKEADISPGGLRIQNHFINHRIPKFLYFDEYYELPSDVDLARLASGNVLNESEKTAKALFNLADINIDELLQADSFEEYISELEATANLVTKTLFKYWKTNGENKLRLLFTIDRQNEAPAPKNIFNIRVYSDKHQMSLPLGRRSKGFNWFFSFVVWFNQVKDDLSSNYVLLLDEPGLNLHAAAQADLLEYIEDLSQNHQVIFTTHSPFMVDSSALHRVRTVFDDKEGSTITESIQQKDPDTLFPLQAALGYDIAQNLFIAKNNLLVEGPADLLYLTTLSAILEEQGREGLRGDVVIVPAGGLDKVASFISLLRGSRLNVVCILDNFTDQKGKARVDALIRDKIIGANRVRFFDEFATVGTHADIEDLFEKSEYLSYLNAVNPDRTIALKDLPYPAGQILPQINKIWAAAHFNHYLPARALVAQAPNAAAFSAATLDRFEALFKALNSVF